MGKEVVEVLRRPRALLSIVAGPVLILGLFGARVHRPAAAARRARDPAGRRAVDRSRPLRGRRRPDRISIAGSRRRPGGGQAVLAAPRGRPARHRAPGREGPAGPGRADGLEVEYDTVSPYRAFVARAAADAIVAGRQPGDHPGRGDRGRRPGRRRRPAGHRSRPRSPPPRRGQRWSTSPPASRTSSRSTGSWCWP